LDRNETMLVENPGRVFPPVAGAEPKLFEGLLAPFRILGHPVGTVWVLSHDAERKFDGEDARVLEGLADFAAAAFMLMESLSGAVNARDELARSHARLMQTNDRLWVRMNSAAKEPQR
jgi:GAF domain-containing protein